MSRIYRPRDYAPTATPQLPSADLLREVRDIERRRVLLDMRDAIDRVPTRDSYTSSDRKPEAVKADILAALRRLEETP